MPPKVKVTKNDIINSAVDIVRKSGVVELNARSIAIKLNCSTQPIFSNFDTMDELKLAVVKSADELCEKYIEKEIKSEAFPPYKASGMAYIRFAKEEKELFKLLYMRNREFEDTSKASGFSNFSNDITTMVQNNIGISKERANLFHLEMWAFVHGIATMIATGFLELDWDLISQMLTDSYQGLKKRYEDKE